MKADVRGRGLALALMVAVLLMAAAVRLHMIDAQSLWNDEGNAYMQTTRSIGEIADNAARDIHPPGYYWLLAGWTRLLGASEFGLRSLSAFAGVLTVALTFALGRRLFTPSVGVLAAVFVTLNTFSIYYGQEARMYALLAMWGVASMWAFVVFMQSGRRNAAIALALVNSAGLYTHYAFPFVMLAQGVAFVLWSLFPFKGIDRQRLTAFVGLNLLTIALFAPWLPTALDQITTWPSTGDPIPFSNALATILAYFAFGITTGSGITIAVVFFLLFALLQVPSVKSPRQWWSVMLPVLWIALSVGLFLALDLFREANLKFLLTAQVAFALWMARGVWVLWGIQPRNPTERTRHIPKAAAVMGVLYLFVTLAEALPPLYNDPAYRRDDYRAIVQTINANPRPNDAILLNAPGQIEVFGYYYDGDAPIYPLPRGLGGDDAATLAEVESMLAEYGQIYAVLWGTDERDPNNVVEGTLNAQAFQVDSTWYGDVRLVRYVAPLDMTPLLFVVDQRFGDHITLTHAAVSATEIRAGDVLQIQLHWQTDAPPDVRYKVFVQLLNPDGTLALQRDAEPAGNDRPTTTWTVGETIIDNHALIIPDDLTAAHYALIIGLYDSNDPLDRLQLGDGADHFLLETITVTTN